MAVVNVVGGRELRRDLKRAGVEMSDMAAVNVKVAGMVADAATVPRVSGALASSVRPANQVARAIVRAGKGRVPYANPVHWGWPKRNIRPNTFLIDAAQKSEPRWVEMYRVEVQAIVDTVTGVS